MCVLLSRHVYFLRERCVSLVCTHTFSSLWNQETLVHGQALFTADHALFTSQWYMDPWVLFQLSEQPCERWCSRTGGPLSDLQASFWEMEMRRRKRETLWSPLLYKLFTSSSHLHFFFIIRQLLKLTEDHKFYLITRQTHCYSKRDINETTYFIFNLFDNNIKQTINIMKRQTVNWSNQKEAYFVTNPWYSRHPLVRHCCYGKQTWCTVALEQWFSIGGLRPKVGHEPAAFMTGRNLGVVSRIPEKALNNCFCIGRPWQQRIWYECFMEQ